MVTHFLLVPNYLCLKWLNGLHWLASSYLKIRGRKETESKRNFVALQKLKLVSKDNDDRQFAFVFQFMV